MRLTNKPSPMDGWMTTKKSKLLQGEDSRGSGAVTRPSTAMSSTNQYALLTRPRDWIRDNPVHSAGKGLNNLTF